jgi:hypothetical protein
MTWPHLLLQMMNCFFLCISKPAPLIHSFKELGSLSGFHRCPEVEGMVTAVKIISNILHVFLKLQSHIKELGTGDNSQYGLATSEHVTTPPLCFILLQSLQLIPNSLEFPLFAACDLFSSCQPAGCIRLSSTPFLLPQGY